MNKKSQKYVDHKTGAVYYRHQPESNNNTQKNKDSAYGYIDPYSEFNNKAYNYHPDEINAFNDTLSDIVDKNTNAGISNNKSLSVAFSIDTSLSNNGPFKCFEKSLECLLRSRFIIRELIALLGPLTDTNCSSQRDEIELHGGFFYEMNENNEEIYTLIKDLPEITIPIEDEIFDEETVDALIQERLRIKIKLQPFSYVFVFV